MTNKSISNNINEDYVLSKIVVGFYYMMIVNNIAKRLLNYSGNLILIALFILVIALCFQHLPIVIRRCINAIVFSELLVVSLYTFSYLFGTPHSVVLHYIMQTAVFVFFGGIMYGINDYSALAESMKKNSYMYLLLLSFVYLKKENFVYIMSHSYLMLIPTLIHITIFIQEKNIFKKMIHLLLVVYELYTILIIGSRGPLLAILVYSLTLGIILTKNLKTKIIVMALFAFAYYAVFVNGENTYRVLRYIGVNSRSLMLIFTDRQYDSGRSALAQLGTELIQQKPWFGWGVAGDSQFMDGGYVHNLLLELKIDYGIVLGTMVYIFIYVGYFTALIKSKFTWIVVMMICVGFIPLFVSNSYLLSFDFILSVFMTISILIKQKDNKMCDNYVQ